MRVRHRSVEVRITGRTLWVEDEAYPLRNITSVRPRVYRPLRWRMVGSYLRRAGGSLGFGAAGLVVLGCLRGVIPPSATTVFALVMLGVLGFHTWRLVQLLRLPKVCVLSISTAGTTRAVVTSTEEQQIRDLARHVVDAIDNPAMDYAIRIDHIDIIQGDKVNGDKIDGDKIMGDFVEGDKVLL
ncbi:hypothetical protein Cs7R123_62980 [Catellatospora sp. TT07R-123]|uniref:DUF6232 family protein n=1 Tax=Catellatospora sp. TT07R-123 TaxID=2733863 RepID=UPI001B090D45|nr:DUF6232 family protein [Catellatospora sp. TT07R-123]GHJ48956.1 hypothetical protein Cs7R123_62980 [Catellatospora sp. TT07R-123]